MFLLSSLIQHKFSKPITKETNRCLGIAAGAWRRSHSKINMSPNTLSRVLLNYQFANKKRQKRSKQIKKDAKFCSNLVHFRLTKGNFYILILCTNDRTWNRFIWYMSRALNFWNNGFEWVSLSKLNIIWTACFSFCVYFLKFCLTSARTYNACIIDVEMNLEKEKLWQVLSW